MKLYCVWLACKLENCRTRFGGPSSCRARLVAAKSLSSTATYCADKPHRSYCNMDDFDAHDRPSKRRRLSDDVEQQVLPAVAISDGLSRIKKKTIADPRTDAASDQKTEHNGSTLQSIQDSMDDNEPLTFTDLGVSPWLIQSLKNLSISHPTRIQKSTIPQILAGRDCIGGSRTGSGKTIAFSLPILQQWSKEPSGIFALILTPTRELALQIYEQIQAIGGNQGIRSVLVTGGAEMRKQAIELEKRPHVVIATPGRLADHVLNSGEDTIKGFRKVKFVVFDEADRLLQSGKGSMLGDVERCLDAVPSAAKRQTLLFTATVTPEVRALKESARENGKTFALLYFAIHSDSSYRDDSG